MKTKTAFLTTITICGILLLSCMDPQGKGGKDSTASNITMFIIGAAIFLYAIKKLVSSKPKKPILVPLFIAMTTVGAVLTFPLLLGSSSEKNKNNNSIEIHSTTTNNNSENSTIENCVVCRKRCDYYHENMYMGHHVVIGGLKSGDVVCGIECDMKLRRRNERIIKEESDPNRYKSDITYPDMPK